MAGRPRKKVDVFALEKMAEKLWPLEEIAATLRISTKILYKYYIPLIEECRQRGKAKLRDLQWQRALGGSDRMLIHMSKHKLAEYEKIEQTVTANTTIHSSPALSEILNKLREDL